LKSKRGYKKRSLGKQRIRRKRKSHPWSLVARVLGSAFVKIGILVAVLVILSGIFIFCYQFVMTSPFFSLKRLNITGVGRQEQRRISQLCDLRKGQNLLALKLNKIREILEKDPWIRRARVERQLPDTLNISVVREEPWAIVIGERLYYMNRWGEVFKEVAPGEPVDLPVVTGLSDLGSEAGQELRTVASLIGAIKKDREVIGVGNISEIHIDDAGHFSVYFEGIPSQVQMATTGLEIQLTKLGRLVRHLRQTGRIDKASRIDLGYSGGAVVSFRPGAMRAREVNRGA